MLDEKLLDGMNIVGLSWALEYVLKTIKEIEAERSEGEDDPRLDILFVFGNKIITRMDSTMRELGLSDPELLAKWKPVMDGYIKDFEKFEDTLLEEDTLLDFE